MAKPGCALARLLYEISLGGGGLYAAREPRKSTMKWHGDESTFFETL